MPLTNQIRYAARMLRLNPGFAAVAIVTLGLGIGATTAMFSVLDGVVLKSLRYPDVERIVAVNTRFTDEGRSIWRTTSGDLEDLRAMNIFEAFSFCQNWETGVQLAKSAEFVQAAFVDTNFFRVFSIAPQTGRLFTPEDADRSAVVGLAFAQRNFGSASAAIGQAIAVGGKVYEIAGVLPAMFEFPDKGQVWVAMSPIPENRGNRNGYNYHVVAKLRTGVTTSTANAQLQALATRLATAFPRDNGNKTFTVTPLQDQLSAPVRSTLLILMGAVGLVLLTACANVANLMLARATARSRELAVRSALGASRGNLVGQLLAESAVLATLAAVLGIALSVIATKTLLALGTRFMPGTLLAGITLDWRVLVFALAAALVTSIVFGIAPA